MDKKYKNLSKALSHALRHQPGLYDITIEEEGWADLDQVLKGIHRIRHLKEVPSREDVSFILTHSDKQRFELEGDKIRALYGHSIKQNIEMSPEKPPELLYHGTSHEAVKQIRLEGLRSMKRQHVHLSVDKDTAKLVGKRKTNNPVILEIQALKAHQNGISFYNRNDSIWLAEAIAPDYIIFE